MESDSVRVRRNSALTVMLFSSVTSTPSSGEKLSLMLTVGTFHPNCDAISLLLV